MIANKIPNLPDVYLVSSIEKSAFRLDEHLANRAQLVYVIVASIVFDAGKSELIDKLLQMFEAIRDTGAERNQLVLLHPVDERKVVLETILLWNNWGGVTAPIIHSVENTLKYMESALLDGNRPISDKCIEKGHDFNVKD